MPDATASALLTIEARSLALLQQTVALHGSKPRNAAPMLAAAIVRSRAAARREGARTMALEVNRALPVLPDARDADRLAAERAVHGYLKALDGVDVKRAAGELVSTSRVIDVKLDLIAATEVPAAFSEERERVEARFVRDNPALVPILVKRWNAHLDRACPVCRALHRTARPWGVAFDGKQPGRAHNRCRCYASYVPIPVFVPGEVRRQQRRAGSAWEVME